MKKSILFFALFLTILSTSLFAQTDGELENRIQEIRQIYTTVNEKVKNDDFLIDKIEINAAKKPEFPAVGVYDKEIVAHYTIGTENDPLEKVFQRLYIVHHYSAYQSSTEYIIDENGNLVFIFYTTGEGKEYRFYFDGEKIIRLVIDKTLTNNPVLEKEVLHTLKVLQTDREDITNLLQRL